MSALILSAVLASVVSAANQPPPELRSVELQYEVASDQVVEEGDLAEVARVLLQRLDPAGNLGVSVTPVGDSSVVVHLPEVTDQRVVEVQNLILASHSFELLIAADLLFHSRLAELATDPMTRQVLDEDGVLVARWLPCAEAVEISDYPNFITRSVNGGVTEILTVHQAGLRITGSDLQHAVGEVTDWGGHQIDVTLTEEGGRKMGRLTRNYSPREVEGRDRNFHLAFVVNGAIVSAPSIRSPLFQHAQISGNFSAQERDDLVLQLQGSILPVALDGSPEIVHLPAPGVAE